MGVQLHTKSNSNYYLLFTLCIILMFLFLPDRLLSKDIEFPLIQSFTYFPYSENYLLTKDAIGVGLDIYHSNVYTFNTFENIMNDFALTSITVGLRYGLSNNFTAELFIKYSVLNGGIMDVFIEDFHSFFGYSDHNRPDNPRNDVNYYNNDFFLYRKDNGTMSPIVFSFLKKIYSKNNISTKARIGIGIPLETKPGLTSDKLFITSGIICTYKRKNLKIDFSNYISWFKKPEWILNEELKNKIYFSELRFKYKIIIIGFIIKTSPFIIGDLSRNAHQIQLGLRINDNIELLLLEDFTPFVTTPDISFNLRIKIK